MTFKFLIPFFLCLAFISCKDNSKLKEDITDKNESSNQLINESDIAKIKYTDFILDEKAEKSIEGWLQYEEFSIIISNLKKADFSNFKENHNVLAALIKGLKKDIPVVLKEESILARILVIQTKLYKLEDYINLPSVKKDELQSVIKEFLEAFSNLNFQINKKLERDSQNIQKPV